MRKNALYYVAVAAILAVLAYVVYLNFDKYKMFALLSIPLCGVVVAAFYFLYKSYSKPKFVLLGAVVIGGLLRFVFVQLAHIIPIHDSELYHALATSLASGEAIHSFFVATFPHTIGYSAVLSVFYKAFGQSVYVGYYLNVVLGMVNILLVYFLAKKAFSVKVGLTAAVITAFLPSYIFYTPNLCTEIIYTTLFLSATLAFLHIIEIKSAVARAISMAVLGAFLGFSNAIRPSSLILVAGFFIFFFAFNTYSKGNFKKILIHLPGFVLMFVILISTSKFIIEPQISRTVGFEISTKYPSGFSMLVGTNEKYSGFFNDEDSKFLARYFEDKSLKPDDIQKIMQETAISRLKSFENPLLFFNNKNRIMWADDERSTLLYADAIKTDFDKNVGKNDLPFIYKYTNVMGKASSMYFFVIVLFCLLGVLMLFKSKANPLVMYLMFFVAVFFAHLFFETDSRYHFYIVPYLVIGAAFAIDSIFRLKLKST